MTMTVNAANNNKNNNMGLMAATAASTNAPTAATDESYSEDHAEMYCASSETAHPVVADSNDYDDEEVDVPPDWIRPLLRGMDNQNICNVGTTDGIECSNSAITSSVRTATIRRFDDGHIPERLANSRKEHPTRIVEYIRKKFGTTSGDYDPNTSADDDACDENTRQCFVFSDAFPQHIVDELYNRTCNNNGDDDGDDYYRKSYPAWGTYVTYQQIEQYWEKKQQQESDRINSDSQDDEEQHEQDTTQVETDMLYVETAARYLDYARMKLSKSHPSKYTHYKFNTHDKTMKMTTSMTIGHCRDAVADAETLQVDYDHDDDDVDLNPLFSSEDLAFVHGVALWGLRADIGSQVPYHLDYAEQIRYTTNVIVPPVLAGTLQCTSQQIHGGSFQLSMEGISHYEQHGYKCKLSPLEDCSSTMKIDERQDRNSKNDVLERNQDDFVDQKRMKNSITNPSDRHSGIVNIPYKYNQLIVHSGDLPHWSTKIESIGEGEGEDGDGRRIPATKAYRVIVGFNVFPGGGVGERVQAAPEHSKAFRQLVSSRKDRHKSLDDLSGQTQSLQEKVKKQTKQLLSATDLCRNKPLGRLLVKAKREQDRKNFKLGQEWLEQNLPVFLPANVQDLLKLGSVSLNGNKTDESIEENNKEQTIPRLHPDDVLVFITHKVGDGTFRVIDSSSDRNQSSKQLVSMKAEIALVT